MGTIYRWCNKISGKGYTGKTEGNIDVRDRRHILGYGSIALKRAMNKYGEDNFTREIIEDGISPEMLNQREIYWIAHFGDFTDGYNMTEGGEGASAGKNHHMYGRTGADNPRYGRKHTLDTRQGMSGKKNPMYGKTSEKCPNTHPEYAHARWIFFIFVAPLDMNIKEKRKHFYKMFPKIPYPTLYRWFCKWQGEESDM